MEERANRPAASAAPIDRERIEADLRSLTDALLELVPAKLRNLTLPPPVAAYLRMTGMASVTSLNLTSTAYATCSAIAGLPDDDLDAMLQLIDDEVEVLRGRAAARELTARERLAVSKVLGELRHRQPAA